MSYMGIDPGDLTPEQMWGRDEQADGAKDLRLVPLRELRLAERADCTACLGEGRQWYWEWVQCKSCLGTGKELSREDYLTLAQEEE